MAHFLHILAVFLSICTGIANASKKCKYESSYVFLEDGDRPGRRFCANYQQWRSRHMTSSANETPPKMNDCWTGPNETDICKERRNGPFPENALVPAKYLTRMGGLKEWIGRTGLNASDARPVKNEFTHFYSGGINDTETVNIFHMYDHAFRQFIQPLASDNQSRFCLFHTQSALYVEPTAARFWFLAVLSILIGSLWAAAETHTKMIEIRFMDGGGKDGAEQIGQEFVEEQTDACGKFLTYNCKLCNCKFNDIGAKIIHSNGRRHRLNYKQKVDPILKVEMKSTNWGKYKDVLQTTPLSGGGELAFQIVQQSCPVYTMQRNRVLKGLMQVGIVAKHSLLNSDNHIELVMLYSKTQIIRLVELFKKNAEIPSNELTVSDLVEESAFALKLGSIPITCHGTLTSTAFRMSFSNVANRAAGGGENSARLVVDRWWDKLEKGISRLDQQMLIQVGHMSFAINDLTCIRQRRTRMCWLKNTIVFAFLHLLQQEKQQDSPFLLISGNQIDSFNKKGWIPKIGVENVIICPVIIRTTHSPHWILIYCNIRQQQLILLDSSNNGETNLEKRLLQLDFFDMLAKMAPERVGEKHDWSISEALRIPQQKTGCACGPHVVAFAQTLVSGGIRSLVGGADVDVIEVRKEMAKKIIANSTLSYLLPQPPTSSSSSSQPLSSTSSSSSSSSNSLPSTSSPSSSGTNPLPPTSSSSSSSSNILPSPSSSSSNSNRVPPPSSSAAMVPSLSSVPSMTGKTQRKKRPSRKSTWHKILEADGLGEDEDGDARLLVKTSKAKWWSDDVPLNESVVAAADATLTCLHKIGAVDMEKVDIDEIPLQHLRKGVLRGMEKINEMSKLTEDELKKSMAEEEASALEQNIGDCGQPVVIVNNAEAMLTWRQKQNLRKRNARKRKNEQANL